MSLVTINEPPNSSKTIVLFPWAGGNGGYFRKWISLINKASVRILAISLPGRSMDKSKIVRSVQEAANLSFDLISKKEEIFQSSIYLYGHSLGGIIAFELARIMELRNRRICGLFVSSISDPISLTQRNEELFMKQNYVYQLPDKELVQIVKQLGGIPSNLPDDIIAMTLPTVRVDYQLFEEYSCAFEEPQYILSCPIYTFSGTNDPLVDVEGARNWQKFSKIDGDSIIVQNGGHFFIFNAEELNVMLTYVTAIVN